MLKKKDIVFSISCQIDLTTAVNHDLLHSDDDTRPEPAREARVPLDSEMLGLEDKMSADVIDMRPDRFLRAIRDGGSWTETCKKAGFLTGEVEALCAENVKFDLSVVECQLEYHEEQMIKATEALIASARLNQKTVIAGLRKTALGQWRERHPEEKTNE